MHIFTLKNMRYISVSAALAMSLLFAPTVFAQVVVVGPFAGEAVEDFESFGVGSPGDSFDVFGGAATHNKLSGSTPWI